MSLSSILLGRIDLDTGGGPLLWRARPPQITSVDLRRHLQLVLRLGVAPGPDGQRQDRTDEDEREVWTTEHDVNLEQLFELAQGRGIIDTDEVHAVAIYLILKLTIKH